jgi:hypothetical protein
LFCDGGIVTGSTVPDGFITEVRGDLPGISLNGGLDGSGEKLPEQIQAKFITTDATLASLSDRLDAIENGTGGVGWIPIAFGSAPAGHSFSVDLTDGGRFPSPPLWGAVRVTMRLDLTAADLVVCRVNGDSDAVYQSGGAMIASDGVLEEAFHYTANTVWALGRTATAGTNNLEMTIFNADVNPGLLGFQATISRQSSSPGVHQYGVATGATTSGGKTLTSLLFMGNASTDFVNAWWIAEGLRTVHPS